MTAVDTETGELLDQAEAERRATRIGLRLDTSAENFEAAMELMRAAIRDRDDLVLGYRSPGDYLSDRFGGKLARLGVDLRREVVRELTEAGLSTRAIAPVLGVGASTVKRDVQVAHMDHLPQTPAPPSAGQASGAPEAQPKAAPDEESTTAAAVQVATDDSTAATPEGETPATPRPPVVGIDGKTYSRPPAAAASTAAEKPQRRRPLPDAFFEAVFDAGKALERLNRLVEDDRFPSNAEQVAARYRNDLLRSRDLLQQVINKLDTKEHTHG